VHIDARIPAQPDDGVLKLYDFIESGNGFKVRLLLSQLHIPFQYIEKDILTGETRKPDFLAKNPNGRIPLVELEDGTCLAESNAIMWYFAEGTKFIPEDRLERAQVLQWMFFEQYSHEPYVAVARFILLHTPEGHPRRAELPKCMERGKAALSVMEQHLAKRRFFVAERYTIADIALYAYTHIAHQGAFDLSPYPAVRAWLDRVAEQPEYRKITVRP
jgi:glutathione S-transferase